MNFELIKSYWNDLRCIRFSRKRYKTPTMPSGYWHKVAREYRNTEKRVQSTRFRWYVLTYRDKHKELAYLRVLSGGFFSGEAPALYRGIIIPHRINLVHYSFIKSIRLAF